MYMQTFCAISNERKDQAKRAKGTTQLLATRTTCQGIRKQRLWLAFSRVGFYEVGYRIQPPPKLDCSSSDNLW